MREVFPDMPMSIILEDLRATRSVELTIENIVDGRVTIPPVSNSNDEFICSDIVISLSELLNITEDLICACMTLWQAGTTCSS